MSRSARRRLPKARPPVRRLEHLEPRYVLDSTVVFNELMFHPASASTTPEWVELRNLQSIDTDISGWKIADGINYTFPTGTIIKAGGYLVVAANTAAMASSTGFTTSIGPFSGTLSNSGEDLQLLNNAGRIMDEMSYADGGDWPVAPDGSGATLAKLDPEFSSADPASWSTSLMVGGTPGRPNDGRAAIATLFGTGLDANRNLLPVGTADPHWRDVFTGANLLATSAHPAWVPNNIKSQWINQVGMGTTDISTGPHAYSTTFDLTGLDPDSAAIHLQVASDNELTDVLLNGQSLNIAYNSYATLSSEIIVDSGFVVGTNTLEFRFNNGGGPGGLRAVLSC